MNSVECFLVHDGKVLMARSGARSFGPLTTGVEKGESPIEAAARLINQETRLHLSPSCAGLYFRLTPGHLTEYGLAFVAYAQEKAQARPGGEFRWLSPVELAQDTEVAAVYREITERFLATDHPLAVVLTNEEGGTIETSRVEAVSAIDPAVLSPLVFSAQS